MLFFCKILSAEIPLSIQYRRFTTTRHILSINNNWYFSKEATAVPEALCTDWEAVNVPHCWNAVDGQGGGNDYWRGTAYYAKSITKADLPKLPTTIWKFRVPTPLQMFT